MQTDFAPELVAEGKTKKLYLCGPYIVDVESKDDLTAGNGVKHDILEGKGILTTETTCNVFELLRDHKLPLAYMGRVSDRVFRARRCEMISLEVVARLENAAGSSFAKRRPEVAVGSRFAKPEVEFYLKTKDKKWINALGTEFSLPVDDPYLVWMQGRGKFLAYHPAKPIEMQAPLFEVLLEDLGLTFEDRDNIEGCTLEAADILETAWRVCADARLKDFKVEYGWYSVGKFERPKLLMADTLENDSWRIEIDGEERSKEIYRQDGDLEVVLKNYQMVAELSKKFLEGIRN